MSKPLKLGRILASAAILMGLSQQTLAATATGSAECRGLYANLRIAEKEERECRLKNPKDYRNACRAEIDRVNALARQILEDCRESSPSSFSF